MSIEGNTSAALEFLRQWEPEGPWTLTAIDPERGSASEKQRIETKQFLPGQNVAAWIDSYQGKRNIYFSANRAAPGTTKKTKKDAITHALCLHVDVDPNPPPLAPEDSSEPFVEDYIAEHYANEQERILGLLQSYEPKPSVIIYSGGGYQGFWRLNTPVEIAGDAAFIEDRNRHIEYQLTKTTVCWNIDRIMRLPGTINVPNEKKRKAGRVPALAILIEADWDLVYSANDFPAQGVAQKPKETPKKKRSRRTDRIPPEWCSRVIEFGPDEEGKYSYGGDRSKAVFAVATALVRTGWSDDEIAEVLSNKDNKISDHVYAQDGTPRAYAEKQARKARDKVGTDFILNEREKPVSSQYNIGLALTKLDVTMTYNEFSRRVMINGLGKPDRYYDDNEESDLYLAIDRVFGFRPSREFYSEVVLHIARSHSYHPVKEYLDGLTWDGQPRLDSWLHLYAGAEHNEYTSAVGKLILLAAVRRIRQPGCKFDEIMMFESKQGLNKSSALKILATRDDWFSDSLPLNADDKEVIEQTSGKWIVETAELRGMGSRGIEHLKAFLSRQTDRARMAYGRHTTEALRQFVMFGSTNSKNYLRDDQNRRFWPVAIVTFLLEELKRDVDQLWAEASHREALGESIRLDPSLYALAEMQQSERAIDEPWADAIEHALGQISGGRILTEDVWLILDVKTGQRTQEQNSRIGSSMQKLGWERVKYTYQKGKRWFYAKGDKLERERRVFITRDEMTNKLRISVLDEEPVSEDRDIPF